MIDLDAEKNEICRLMGLIPNPDRMSEIITQAALFKDGQLEGTEVFGIILHKTWSTPTEQELFDKMLALFIKTKDTSLDIQ